MYPYYNQPYAPSELYLAEMARRKEKSGIRKAAWVIAISGAVFYYVSAYISEALVFIGALFGATQNELAGIFADPIVNDLLQIVLSMFLLVVPFTVFCKVFGNRISDTVAFSRPKKGTRLPLLLIGVGFCAFANVAVFYAGEIFEKFGFKSGISRDPSPEGAYEFIMAIIATAIVPAVVEEYAFRGIALGLLKPYGEAFAILGSAAAFGILHGNFEQIPFAFLVGLVLGYIRIKSDSMIICVAVHMLNNLISVLLSYATFISGEMLNLAYNIYIVLALVAAILGLALLKGEKMFRFDLPERTLSAKQTYVTFFFSPAMLIFTGLFLFRALSYAFL